MIERDPRKYSPEELEIRSKRLAEIEELVSGWLQSKYQPEPEITDGLFEYMRYPEPAVERERMRMRAERQTTEADLYKALYLLAEEVPESMEQVINATVKPQRITNGLHFNWLGKGTVYIHGSFYRHGQFTWHCDYPLTTDEANSMAGICLDVMAVEAQGLGERGIEKLVASLARAGFTDIEVWPVTEQPST